MNCELKKSISLFFGCVLVCTFSSCASNHTDSGYKTTTVSFYADKFEGKKTSSGEIYRHNKMTASNKNLPFGTRVEIINTENDKKIVITVNDRGAMPVSRQFDLSQGAFKKIGNLKQGVVKVKYRILK